MFQYRLQRRAVGMELSLSAKHHRRSLGTKPALTLLLAQRKETRVGLKSLLLIPRETSRQIARKSPAPWAAQT